MLKFGEMFGFTKRLNEIVRSKTSKQAKMSRLSTLMTDLEQAYDIPSRDDAEFNKENPFVMKLYQVVKEEKESHCSIEFSHEKRHVG